ncbi:F-box/FBD/LRR-repeat protein At4g00160-like [Abrus precatorius]|uniref:F-box/FBD/LRR-repeat protein At4g00160-like n=1 Tax=Abrus precatorius TaxID=3816 RepID=A0A8B8L4X8_ABRPR|nr:F-box/FBD/LRR-repeat protein At4g00160-like [Abrus precatorius]
MADTISTLPDELLCHILSFLQTKHAVATSVLSKRWNPLWRSIPILDFNDDNVKDEKGIARFVEFVDYVLHARDAKQAIESFHFMTRSALFDVSSVEKLVNLAMESRVAHLDLCVGKDDEIPILPFSVLSCNTLVVLDVCGFRVPEFSSIELRSLKTLRLEAVHFESFRSFMDFLAGCPNLEDFEAEYVIYDSEDDYRDYGDIKSSTLNKLMKASIFDCDIPFPPKIFHNVEFLCMEIPKEHRCYSHFPTFYNLTCMELFFLDHNWDLLVELLKHTPKLQNLSLDVFEDDEDGRISVNDKQKSWTEPECVPECLSSHLRTCTLGNFVGLQRELDLARYITKNARVLQSIKICTRGKWKVFENSSSCPLKDMELCIN